EAGDNIGEIYGKGGGSTGLDGGSEDIFGRWRWRSGYYGIWVYKSYAHVLKVDIWVLADVDNAAKVLEQARSLVLLEEINQLSGPKQVGVVCSNVYNGLQVLADIGLHHGV
ncbi:hypothetical protein V498_10107, partial [Pseudogymnoascus sp. VKM F-4517 (FW-2822)]